jgi:DNA-binding transcriptional regulator of glucitol operon
MRRSPGWVGGRLRAAGLLLLVLIAVGVMLRLSLWQWDRAQAHHRLLNYTYAVEWVLFAVLTVAGVARLAVEARRRTGGEPAEPEPQPRSEGILIGPPLQPGEELPEITLVRLRRRLRL